MHLKSSLICWVAFGGMDLIEKVCGGGGVSDCCLTQLTARTSYIRSDDDDVGFVLDQCTDLDFYSAS
jgi:hypothetical protein